MIFSTFSYLLGVLCGSAVNYATTPLDLSIKNTNENACKALKFVDVAEEASVSLFMAFNMQKPNEEQYFLLRFQKQYQSISSFGNRQLWQ